MRPKVKIRSIDQTTPVQILMPLANAIKSAVDDIKRDAAKGLGLTPSIVVHYSKILHVLERLKNRGVVLYHDIKIDTNVGASWCLSGSVITESSPDTVTRWKIDRKGVLEHIDVSKN